MLTPNTDSATDEAVEHLVSCVEATARRLSAALARYWPAMGNSEIAEANLVVNLAATLVAKEMHVLAEVPFLGRPNEHGDLFAMNNQYAVLVEAKRLYHAGKAAELAMDYRRALGSELPHYVGSQAPQPVALACAVATTWQPQIQGYWCSDERVAPGGARGWRALLEDVLLAPSVRRIGSFEIQTCQDWGTQHLLYVVGVRERPFTPGDAAGRKRSTVPRKECARE